MSARQLARLRALVEEKRRKEEELKQRDIREEEEEEEEGEEEECRPTVSFSALAFSDSEDDTEDESEEEREEEEEEEQVVTKKADPKVNSKDKEADDMAYLDSLLKESEQMQGPSITVGTEDSFDIGRILNININKFNDEREQELKFGKSGDEENNEVRAAKLRYRRHMIHSGFSSIFVSPNDTFVRAPSLVGGGFCFQKVDVPYNFDSGMLVPLDSHAVFYTFQASKEYEALVREYKSYKVSAMSDDIVEQIGTYYQKHPYNLSTIFDVILFSMYYKWIDTLIVYLRRAVFIIEKAVGPSFNFNSGQSRLLYSDPDNQLVYRIFQYYMLFALRESCYETALNMAMLIFSFFPQADPKGCLLLIPFLALSANKPQIVRNIAESGIPIGTMPLILLPNWSFDYALALLRLDKKDQAKEVMRDGLLRWPEIVRKIASNSSASLYIPTNVKEHPIYNHEPADEAIELMEDVFVMKETRMWAQAKQWQFMMDCMKEVINSFDEAAFEHTQQELLDSYDGLNDFFDHFVQLADISDNLFTVKLTDFSEDIPAVDMKELIGDVRAREMDEQIEAMRVDNNIPVDHNMLRLFIEAMNPEMNANELNDDDLAAMQEQMMEFINAQENGEQEERWEEDWNSDEE